MNEPPTMAAADISLTAMGHADVGHVAVGHRLYPSAVPVMVAPVQTEWQVGVSVLQHPHERLVQIRPGVAVVVEIITTGGRLKTQSSPSGSSPVGFHAIPRK